MIKRQFCSLFLFMLLICGVGSFDLAYAQTNTEAVFVADLDWSPNENEIAVAFNQWGEQINYCVDGSEIVILNTDGDPPRRIFRPGDVCSVTSVEFNQDGSQLVLTGGATYETWDIVTEQRIQALSSFTAFQDASWSPDGSEILVTALTQPLIVNPFSGSVGTLLAGTVRLGFVGDLQDRFIYSQWNPNGQTVASSLFDNRIHVWSSVNAQLVTTFTSHNAPVKRLAWNPVSNVIASGDDNGVIWLWDATTGQSIRQLTGHTGIVYDLDWHPNGQQLASASGDNTLRVWDTATGMNRIIDSAQLFSAVAYSPDGTQLAYGGEITNLANLAIDIVDTPILNTAQILGVPASIVLDEATSQWFTYTVRLSDVPTPPPGSPHNGVVVTITEQSPQIEMMWMQVNTGSGWQVGNSFALYPSNYATGVQVRIRARRNSVNTTGDIGRLSHRITTSEATNYTLTIVDANGRRVSGSVWTGGNDTSAPTESRNVVRFTVTDDD